MDYLKLFKKFLEDNNVLSQYITNVINYNYLGQRVYPMNFIVHTFFWINTPEKHSFWFNLHKKWTSICSDESHVYLVNDVILYLSADCHNEEELWTM